MDIVTLGAALNGSAEQTKNYVESHFVAGTNILIDNNPDGTQTISATGEVSSEDTYARDEISNHKADTSNPHSVTASQVGLGNVTNDAQVKKISSAVSGDIVTWSGTGGDAVADSGVSIETSISDSDSKVPTSKAVNTALSNKQDASTAINTTNLKTTAYALGSVVNLGDSGDLNTLTAIGNYYGNSANILNRPANIQTFRLIVQSDGNTANYVEQIFNEYQGAREYRRYNTSSISSGEPVTWSDWVLVNDNISTMAQSEATAGTSTNGRLISAKVLSDTIDEKIQPLETDISNQQDAVADGGNGYAIINNQRLYMGSVTPTGTIPDNSVWLYNGMQIRTTATEEFAEFPATIKASGAPLVDYTITGNTGGVAARTGNDFDKNNIVLTNLYPNQSTGEATQGSATTFSMVVPVDFEGDGVFWIASTVPNRMRIAGYTTNPTEGATATFVDNSGTTENDYIINTFTIPANSNTSYLLIMLSAQSSTESELRTLLESVQVMVSRGSTKVPYEKYYCVPVVSGGVTTKLYIDTPLGSTDTLTYTQTGVAIPTSDGDNIISFSTTVQPSAMSAEYKGWHKV